MNNKLKMLAIDLGASSGRGIIGEYDGQKLDLFENHRFPNIPVNVTGRLYWDILRIFNEIKTSVGKTVIAGEDIATMGIDTWGVDYGLLDRQGRLMSNPVHYRDIRTDGIESYMDNIILLSDIYMTTGIQSLEFNTVYQLAAEKRDDATLFERVGGLLFIPDLLNYFLTGLRATEYTVASTGALINAAERKFAFDLTDRLGISRDIFAPMVDPCNRLGGLSKALTDEIGSFGATVVNVASHDTASAVLSVPSKNGDFVFISSGTWSLMGIELKAPLINDETRAMNFTNEGGANGTVRFLKNIMGLWILQESRRQWERQGTEYSFAELEEAARAAEPLTCFIDPDDKMFSTPGNMPKRICEYCARTNQKVPESVGEIVRCIMDSLALKYRMVFEKIVSLTQKRPKAINIVGGGTKDKLLCRLTCEACNIPVIAGPVEATSAGNLLVQLMSLGELNSLEQARELISASFKLDTYEPSCGEEREKWDAAYDRFCKIAKM